ncbi:hypothetical protein JHW43_004551 [Diplocarpon mali]|nr:hypothetical protein JHW43_004551 [Diplocarpon mali]
MSLNGILIPHSTAKVLTPPEHESAFAHDGDAGQQSINLVTTAFIDTTGYLDDPRDENHEKYAPVHATALQCRENHVQSARFVSGVGGVEGLEDMLDGGGIIKVLVVFKLITSGKTLRGPAM